MRFHPEVAFRFVGPNDPPPACRLIVLPGSKAVQADLAWFTRPGLGGSHPSPPALHGGRLIGICGGLQMLDRALHDHVGLEGVAGSIRNLDWRWTHQAQLAAERRLENVSGELPALPGSPAGRQLPPSTRKTNARGAAAAGQSGGSPRRPARWRPVQRQADSQPPTATARSIHRRR
ncbi:MAG: hypothetical protein IPL11_19130 [Candidatus Accumulibacter sp.]|nr:hypothetical protein [Accumulibacter sp.]